MNFFGRIDFLMLNNNDECYYDERQIKERGKIFKISFLILVFYNFIVAFFDSFDIPWFDWFDYFQSSFIGIMISVTICTILMITKNAYISPNNITWTHIAIGIMTLSGIIGMGANIQHFNVFSIIISTCILLIVTTYWIKLLLDKIGDNNIEDD